MEKRYLTGKEKNQFRAMLRKEYKAGRLEYRRTYYDYYDSCHAPSETPDAPWEQLKPELANRQTLNHESFKNGGPLIYLWNDGTIELFTGWSNYQIRMVR